MIMFKRIQAPLCLLLALGLAACSFAPNYQRPEQDLPSQWKTGGKMYTPPLESRLVGNAFNDPILTNLVDEALKN